MEEASVSTIDGGKLGGSVLAGHSARTMTDVACRTLDLVVTVAALLVLAPLFLLIAVLIKLDTPGPVLFRQQRVGRGRKPFMVAKFRTMHHGACDDVHRDHILALIESGTKAGKLAADSRVTRIGGFLRRTSLDELPQLFNVLVGDMSLVGPRPAIAYEVDAYPPHWLGRLAVKPGVTGLWQVSGRSEVSLEEMIELDIEYVRRRSVVFNLWLLLRTVPAVLSMRGAG
jgi:lipopolysaccharide/colanic/teichoic acid biosynthesis glycosyltransferase